MGKLLSDQRNGKLLDLLAGSIVGLDKISSGARKKISDCFKERKYMPRMKLIEEGEISNTAFIIKKGT
jgi:hypothetical protein